MTELGKDMTTMRTNNHSGELEALPHALPMNLVGKIGKANIAVELFADDRCRCRLGGLGKRRRGTVGLACGAVGGKGIAVRCRNV